MVGGWKVVMVLEMRHMKIAPAERETDVKEVRAEEEVAAVEEVVSARLEVVMGGKCWWPVSRTAVRFSLSTTPAGLVG